MSTKPSTKSPPTKGQSEQQKRAARQAAFSNSEAQAAQEARVQAQAERQRQTAEATQRKQKTAKIRNAAIVGVILVVLGGGVVKLALDQSEMQSERNVAGELVPQQSSPHIQTVDSPHAAYTTDPPTSGPHVPQVPHWGIYDQPIRKELQVHALEDAGVVINYQPGLDQPTVDRLKALTTSYSDNAGNTADSYDNHVLLSPYEKLDHKIVLTAWRRILRLDAFDEAKIKLFINAYKNIDHHGDSGDR